MKKTFFTFAVFLVLYAAINAAPGDLDTSFDTDDKVPTQINGFIVEGNAGTQQADGKIVAAGFAGNSFATARYLTSGTLSCGVQLDLSFGECGKVITNFGNTVDSAFDVAFQTDGKILVAGLISGSFGVARYNPNGALDTSFDGDGFVVFSPPGGNPFPATSIAVQTDGKIVVGGEVPNENINIINDILIVRFNADGSLDNSFSGDGSLRQAYPYFQNRFWGLRLLPDGKIIAVSYSFGNFSGESNVVISGYNGNGTLDTTFNDDGYALGGAIEPRGMTVAPNGKIIIVSFGGFVGVFNPDGSPDTEFDGDGMIEMDIDGKAGGSIFLYSVTVQTDGKILVGGVFAYNNGDPANPDDSLVARLNADGSLDNSFSGDGVALESFLPAGLSDRPIVDVAVQPDGKIIAAAGDKICGAANCQEPFFNLNFDLIRYNADGTPDTALWGTGGKVSSDFMMSEDEAAALKIQPDGKIVVVGKIRYSDFSDTDFAIARYNGDFAPPTSANVSLSGRVVDSNGQGISRTSVSLTDSGGGRRTVSTNSFGYYRFTEVPAGQVYVVSVSHKRYAFSPDSRVLNVADNLSGIDFTAEP